MTMKLQSDLEYDAYFQDCMNSCSCPDKPCEGVLAGSICDSDPEFFHD